MQSYWELNQQIGTLLPSLSHNQLGIQIHPNANVQGRFLKLYIFLKPNPSTLRILLQQFILTYNIHVFNEDYLVRFP